MGGVGDTCIKADQKFQHRIRRDLRGLTSLAKVYHLRPNLYFRVNIDGMLDTSLEAASFSGERCLLLQPFSPFRSHPVVCRAFL